MGPTSSSRGGGGQRFSRVKPDERWVGWRGAKRRGEKGQLECGRRRRGRGRRWALGPILSSDSSVRRDKAQSDGARARGVRSKRGRRGHQRAFRFALSVALLLFFSQVFASRRLRKTGHGEGEGATPTNAVSRIGVGGHGTRGSQEGRGEGGRAAAGGVSEIGSAL